MHRPARLRHFSWTGQQLGLRPCSSSRRGGSPHEKGMSPRAFARVPSAADRPAKAVPTQHQVPSHISPTACSEGWTRCRRVSCCNAASIATSRRSKSDHCDVKLRLKPFWMCSDIELDQNTYFGMNSNMHSEIDSVKFRVTEVQHQHRKIILQISCYVYSGIESDLCCCPELVWSYKLGHTGRFENNSNGGNVIHISC